MVCITAIDEHRVIVFSLCAELQQRDIITRLLAQQTEKIDSWLIFQTESNINSILCPVNFIYFYIYIYITIYLFTYLIHEVRNSHFVSKEKISETFNLCIQDVKDVFGVLETEIFHTFSIMP